MSTITTSEVDGKIKFEAIDSLVDVDKTNRFTFLINSSSELVFYDRPNENSFINEEKQNETWFYANPTFYNYLPEDTWDEKRHIYNFQDICSKRNADCTWEHDEKANFATVSFNSSSFIDPDILNVTACRTLDSAGQTYLQNISITTTTTCFVVTADNVTFDGNLFTVDHNGDGSSTEHGLTAIDHINLTVKNATFRDFGRGFNWDKMRESLLFGNILLFNGDGIFLDESDNNTLDFNLPSTNDETGYGTGRGISLLAGSDFNILTDNLVLASQDTGILISVSNFNNLTHNIITGNINHGIFLSGSDNIFGINNTMDSNSGYGLFLSSSDDNTFINTTISDSVDAAISIQSGFDNSFIFGNISDSANSGIKLKGVLTRGGTVISNNTFQSISILNTTPNFYDIEFEDGSSIQDHKFIDMLQLGLENFTFNDGGGIDSGNEFTHSDFGTIKYIDDIDGSGNNLSYTIQIANNSFFTDSINVSGLNVTSNLTFFNSLSFGFAGRVMLRDNVSCPGTICTVLDRANDFVGQVANWTTYSLGARTGLCTPTSNNTLFIVPFGQFSQRNDTIPAPIVNLGKFPSNPPSSTVQLCKGGLR